MKVALLQSSAADADIRETLLRIDQAAGQSADLVVIPGTIDRPGLHAEGALVEALAERARRHGCHLVAQVALPDGEDARSVVVALRPDGQEAARSVLGRGGGAGEADLALFEVGGVLAGILPASDVAQPHAAAACTVAGARLLVVPGGWPARGRTAAGVTCDEVEYMLPARAAETGAWVLHASRCGVEDGWFAYPGRSGVVAPDGEWVVQAPPDQGGIVLHDIDPGSAAPRPAAQRAAALWSSGAGAGTGAVVAAASLEATPSAVDLFARIRTLSAAARARGAALLVLPDLAGLDRRGVTAGEALPMLQSIAAEHSLDLVTVLAERAAETTYKTAYVVRAGEAPPARHRQSALAPAEAAAGFAAGGEPPPVIDLGWARLGLLAAAEGMRPDLASGLREAGADLLAWPAGASVGAAGAITRARAREVGAVVAMGGQAERDGACIAGPDGTVLAETVVGATIIGTARVAIERPERAPRPSPGAGGTTLRVP